MVSSASWSQKKKTMFSDPFWESVSFLLIHINLFPIIIEKS